MSRMRTLPSARLRAYLRQRVQASLADLGVVSQQAIADGLGDLGLYLAHDHIGSWSRSYDELTNALVATGRDEKESEVIVELGLRTGLLKVDRSDYVIYPTEPEIFLFLAGVRTATTEDEQGLMDHRMRGALFDIFAIAVGELGETEEAAGLVRLLFEKEGGWEDKLQLAQAQAAAAIAWGAAVEVEILGTLIPRAFEWAGPTGHDFHRDTATAFLCSQARSEDFGSDVLQHAEELVDTLLEHLSDPDLEENPVLIASLEAFLCVIVAGRTAAGQSIEPFFDKLGLHASLMGEALSKTLVPGLETNALLVEATRSAAKAGSASALASLAGLSKPIAGAAGLIQEALRTGREAPSDQDSQDAAQIACLAITEWTECPELVTHLLGRLTVAKVEPELRISAASALSCHPEALDSISEALLETLEAQMEEQDPVIRTGIVGAALCLGSQSSVATATALGLIADGVPAEVLGPAIDEGIRQSPHQVDGLTYVLENFGSDVAIQNAFMATLVHISEAASAENEFGPYHTSPSLSEYARGEFIKLLLPIAKSNEPPEYSGSAAIALGWVGRGDKALNTLIHSWLDQCFSSNRQALLTLALGACGVPTPETLVFLAAETTSGESQRVEAGAMALRFIMDNVSTGDPLVNHVELIRSTLDASGPHQDSVLKLLYRWATLPLGDDA
jgi:hypothetical protein